MNVVTNAVKTEAPDVKTDRIYFLDTLRSFMILLVIVLHTSMEYITYFQLPPYVNNFISGVHDNLFLSIALFANGETLNSVMFFIAGYFMLSSLVKRGSAKFTKDKLVRLGIPYVFGLFFLAPVSVYIANISSGVQKNYFGFWFTESFLPANIQHLHFWFIGVLLCFFIISGLIYTFIKKRSELFAIRPGTMTRRFAILFIAFTGGTYFLMNLRFHVMNFSNLYLISFQTIMLLSFIAYFSLGIYAYKKDWFKTGYKPKIIPWAAVYIVAEVLYIVFSIYGGKILSSDVLLKLVIDFSLNISIFSALMMLLGIFRRFFNGSSRFLKEVSKGSFGAYIIHFIFIGAVVFFARELPIPEFLKFALQAAICISLSFGAGIVLKKLPVLNKVL